MDVAIVIMIAISFIEVIFIAYLYGQVQQLKALIREHNQAWHIPLSVPGGVVMRCMVIYLDGLCREGLEQRAEEYRLEWLAHLEHWQPKKKE